MEDNFDSLSRGSSQFRESTHLIPSPGSTGQRPKPYISLVSKLWVILFIPLTMIAMALGLEAALAVSQKKGGFPIPTQNLFGFASSQFLLSVGPAAFFIIGPAFAWRELDWQLRWYQPYVVLSRGNAPAEESLLLDYISLGLFFTLFHSSKHKHRIIFWSAVTASLTYFLQPLSGSILQVRQIEQTQDSTAVSIKSIGLVPDVDQLNAFVAAAGFAEAAVFQNLPDPPFIHGGWAAAEFVFPTNPVLNGSMIVNTTGIQTTANCANPAQAPVISPQGQNFTISSKSVDGCTQTVTFNPQSANEQYGVTNAQCPGNTQDLPFQPVMFWYFHFRDDNNATEAKTVFCTPSIKAFRIMAIAYLNDGSLGNVQILDNYTTPNNVTGSPLSGQGFNAVLFSPSTNPFIQARATATNSGVPGAIFRFASQLPNGPQSTFDLANGFLDITSHVYTQHLSVTAKSIYFVNVNSTLTSQMTSLAPRLWIDALPAHLLAIILLFIGSLGLFLQLYSRRQRRNLLVTSPPGSIASIVALTSHSGFGELLLPYDDEETLEKKLSGLRFKLDKRTGAVVADDRTSARIVYPADESTLSLLSQSQNRWSEMSSNSSHYAYQAAAGYPPLAKPMKSPGL